jgi:hypothetical protein
MLALPQRSTISRLPVRISRSPSIARSCAGEGIACSSSLCSGHGLTTPITSGRCGSPFSKRTATSQPTSSRVSATPTRARIGRTAPSCSIPRSACAACAVPRKPRSRTTATPAAIRSRVTGALFFGTPAIPFPPMPCVRAHRARSSPLLLQEKQTCANERWPFLDAVWNPPNSTPTVTARPGCTSSEQRVPLAPPPRLGCAQNGKARHL